MKSILDSVNDVDPIFTGCRDVTSDSTESVSASLCAEGTGDFLFDLYHSDIPFGLIVVERHVEVVHEGENFRFVLKEPVEEIFGRRLLIASPFVRRRIGGTAVCADRSRPVV